MLIHIDMYICLSVDLKALKDDALLETINYSRTTLVARCKFCAIGPPYHQDNLVRNLYRVIFFAELSVYLLHDYSQV